MTKTDAITHELKDQIMNNVNLISDEEMSDEEEKAIQNAKILQATGRDYKQIVDPQLNSSKQA